MIYKKLESDAALINAADSLLLALTVTMDRVEAFTMLLQQAEATGYLPYLHTPCANLLRELGYRQVTLKESVPPQRLAEYLSTLPSDRFIVAVRHGLDTGKQYAFVERRSDLWAYHGLKPLENVSEVSAVWSCEPERKRRPRNIRMQVHGMSPDTAYIQYANPNPVGRLTGDCLLRGFANVLGISWREAADLIARESGYVSTRLNSADIFEPVLLRHGFLKVPAPMAYNAEGGRAYMDGRAFCQWADRTYQDGEYILAESGTSHVVGCFKDESGHYRFHDTWDSASSRAVRPSIYVGPAPESKRAHAKPLRLIDNPVPGMRISHPVFGKGEILSIDTARLQARFPNAGTRLLSTDWVCTHCRPSHEVSVA